MSQTIRIRPARLTDVSSMARVHVDAWAETYRGLVPDHVLDDPDFPSARERQWTTTLTDPRFRTHRVAIAEQGGAIIGIAMSGPAAGDSEPLHLYVLYVLAPWHGTGAGAGLLEAVLARDEAATLWVADPNPRAQAFYRKHGFEPDGTEKVEDDLREIHLTRSGERTRA